MKEDALYPLLLAFSSRTWFESKKSGQETSSTSRIPAVLVITWVAACNRDIRDEA